MTMKARRDCNTWLTWSAINSQSWQRVTGTKADIRDEVEKWRRIELKESEWEQVDSLTCFEGSVKCKPYSDQTAATLQLYLTWTTDFLTAPHLWAVPVQESEFRWWSQWRIQRVCLPFSVAIDFLPPTKQLTSDTEKHIKLAPLAKPPFGCGEFAWLP